MDDMDEGFLKLTNHKDHPTNKAYKVFFFYQEDKALYFEKLLIENIYFLSGVKKILIKEWFIFLGLEKQIIKKLCN